jgi:hypothetical protein
MCHRTRYTHRCGHVTLGKIKRCSQAHKDPITRRWKSCGNISRTETDQPGSLCGKDDCILSGKGGVWICCTCKFGYKGVDRNRYADCSNSACGHPVCNDCLPWTRENVQAMIDAESSSNSSSSSSSTSDAPSPSEQEYWDSNKSDSDVVHDSDA